MRFLEMIRNMWHNMDGKTRLWAGYAMIALLVSTLGWSALAGKVSALQKKRKARETVIKEILPLKVSYMAAKQSSDLLLGRMASLRPDDTPAKIIEETGIKGKGVKISPLKSDERNGIIEETADVRIEGLTLNEAINLIYRLEKGNRPLVLKKCNLRIRFDDASRCDIAMVLALLKPSPVQAK